MEAVKRGKPSPAIDDLQLCAAMGWTYGALMEQPACFVERLNVYLGAVADTQFRDQRRLDEELRRQLRR